MTEPLHPRTADMVRTVARQLAPERRILLAHETFDTLQLMAEAEVRELVLVEPSLDADMPAGQTAHGAPLRMRPDWRERPSSKDLILDLQGAVPVDEVSRILKKAGLYITLVPSEALESLPHVLTVKATPLSGWSFGASDERPEVEEHGATIFDGVVELHGAPGFFIGGKQPLPEALPGGYAVEIGNPAVDAVAEERSARLNAEAGLRTAEANLQAAQRHIDDQRGRIAELETRLAEQQRALEEAEAAAESAGAELAERRIQDRRVDLTEARFKEARQALESEIDELRSRLRASEPEGEDRQRLVEARDAARAAWSSLASQLHQGLRALGAGELPPPPPAASEGEIIDAWANLTEGHLSQVAAAVEARAQDLTARQEAAQAAEQRAREYSEALAALQLERSTSSAPTSPPLELPSPELESRLSTLEGALAAERALRVELDATVRQTRQAAYHAVADRQRLRRTLSELRAEVARARLARASAEDIATLAREEAAGRHEQIADLEAMVEEYRRMLSLVSRGLESAEQDRDQARTELAATTENLRILQGEFERFQKNGATLD